MFKVRGNYPYPILLENAIDYKNSIIKARYLYQGLKNGHNIKIECEINNDEIKKLIQDKKVCYAVQIESPNAMYRDMFEFYDKEEIIITLKNDEVIDYIDIGLALLVKEDINEYKNTDFVDAYKDIKMKVNKNEVLAVFPSVRKMIILSDEITYDPNYDRILIKLPEEIGNYYLTSKGNKEKIIILNSILFTPILTSIVNDMRDDEEEFSNRLWFKTLTNKINEIVREEDITKEEAFDNPYETTQALLKNISVESINELKKLLENQEGDDE